MKKNDIQILNQMREAIVAFLASAENIGALSNRLIILRDLLQFDDGEWSNELTQHIVTLDSASTYTPANDVQAKQVRAAVRTATDSLLNLIDVKVEKK